MPVTPFHFGPGAAVHALAPKQVSFLAFCVVNVLVDIEPLYYMTTAQFPLHRFLHTYIGATVAIGAAVSIFLFLRRVHQRVPLPNLFNWLSVTPKQVAIGAVLGGYSHVLFDSIMHSDVRPFAPLSNTNPLWHLISVGVLHWLCIGAGCIGLLLVLLREFMEPASSAR